MRGVGRRILAGVVVAVSLISASSIASAQNPNLQGFFVGGQFGYSWDDVDITAAAPSVAGASGNFGSAIGGVHGGYNFYQQNGIVIGIVGDFNWLNADTGTSSSQTTSICLDDDAFDSIEIECVETTTGLKFSLEVNWKASIRSKVGAFVAPNMLIYATSGIAFAGIEASASITPPGLSASDSETLVGFVIGGGSEWLIAPNISLFAQVLYYSFGDEDLNLAAGTVNVDLDETVAQVGLTFYLN